ncbi:hypothetical protein [uncultured Citrobacter sp.]|uniref:hypothetical protein n=1 Tax=uncultured Citrobacter sp. TaxID=200446 RepID=UPI002596168D|nr:hypothetical protein [uncultured Citrobacter sp.]
MADWTDLLPTAVRAPIAIYKNKSNLNRWWKKLLVYIGTGDTNVVVTGGAGAGKTVLTTCHHGEVKDHEWKEPDASTMVERKAITVGEWTKVFSVVPGQDIHAREVALNEAFHKHSNLEGVVHVVDYGYTTIRASVVREKLVKSGIDTIQAIRDYNLGLELEEFKRVCDLIANACANGRGPKWIIIAVNKADLFLPELDQAKEYYHPDGSGPFVETLNRLMTRVGSNHLKCRVIPVCPKPKPYEWAGKMLKPALVTYAEPADYMKNFVSIMAEVSSGK